VGMQDPTRWREFFKVSKEQFMTICELVALLMQTTLPPNLKNIPSRYVLVGKQVAIVLRRLALGDSFTSSLIEHFGVSKAIV
ncbi:hypothetical protein SELMODRAFT_103242, partial [Selaginella moellendorffii]